MLASCSREFDYLSSGSYPLTCLAWLDLPGEWTPASIARRIKGARRPLHHVKAIIIWSGTIALQTSWHIYCLNFYWNESKPSFGMCPFLRNFARLPHINFIYLDTWRYAEAYCVKKTQLFDKSTEARTSLMHIHNHGILKLIQIPKANYLMTYSPP